PLQAVEPPAVQDAAWVRNPVDRFIRAKQESAGVQPNGLADPRTLIRRASFDLVGLPPTPADVEQFVARHAEDPEAAWTELVDRLLASEHFGERWARHWLDVVRYAESNGYAFDRDRPNAWHYRDFVIRAFNSDMPWNEFVTLQLAGDLITDVNVQTREESEAAVNRIAATGFIVAGPFTTQQTQKERERSRYEQLDDMIHTMGTSLLGLTVGCSRCHTHKFDPLPIGNYYSLAACFADVGFADTPIHSHPEVYRAELAEYTAAHNPLVQARGEYEQQQLPAKFDQWQKWRAAREAAVAEAAQKARQPVVARRPAEPAAGLTLGVWQHIGPFTASDFNVAYDESFPPEAGIDLAATYEDGKLKWTPQPEWTDGTAHNEVLTGQRCANYLYRTIDSPAPQTVELSLGSDDALRVWVNGRPVVEKKVGRNTAAADQEKVTVQLAEGRNELLFKVVNNGGKTGFYFHTREGQPPADIAAILQKPADQRNEAEQKKVRDWHQGYDSGWLALNAAVLRHEKAKPQPELTQVYAARQRGGTYQFGENTYRVFHLLRGNADNKQDEAEPGFLQILMPGDDGAAQWLAAEKKAEADASPPAVAPRLALASWLADEHNPLTARVMVNRLWQHHFGRGIVSSPNNFGTGGSPPSHPQLLDWLATRFMEGGWKLKSMHREILLSSTWQQSSRATSEGLATDPSNALLWRFPMRRLSAEELRDSILKVNGSFNPKMGGPGFYPIIPPEVLAGQSRPGNGWGSSSPEERARRAIYIFVKRSLVEPLLADFDFADVDATCPVRFVTTQPTQTLGLLNSEFINRQARVFAAFLREQAGDQPADQVALALSRAFQRHPQPQEIQRGVELMESLVRDGTTTDDALRYFCLLTYNFNEFLYLD
ncbi:MAG: DUF1553 domain-containing protein, partial [Planctomycetaceae bacterium]|nr:DUF1553 domain-containing protein [Planctomycetaceae bacterium]